MRRPIQFATVLLTVSFAATTLFAQRSTGGSSNPKPPTPSGARSVSTTASPQATPSPSSGFHRTLSTSTSQSTHVDPFHHPIHLPGGGAGCLNCGYGVYGGYAYSGYNGGYYPGGAVVTGPLVTNPVTPTASDLILANGGTFNNINDYYDQPQQPAPQAQQQPIYIRPEYSTQYAADNSTVNTPIQKNVASASSDSPALLIFKDGNKLEIRNYAIYGAYVVVLTPERKKFPIAALDIAATQKANEEAGYEFKLPAVFTNH